ncbi:hypothetical protein [Streptomyces luteolus]|uniref:Uncharacterized protein n=1 Tax=Streptomyces luteolus TaxID=3043615 RepID=A0ABT6STV9_9ACTN|nr:hypothetical protein [Streptomyces sp. B-S-A12]MDI3419038.1 hypothetical protein [Streptomyces sp. B-S-A12]
MRGEGVFGRDESAAPFEEGMSTEDIARSETQTPQQSSNGDDLTAVPNANRTTPESRITDAAGDELGTEEGGDASAQEPGDAPLLGPQETDALRSRWQDIQQRFVDDPQDSVSAADTLVAEVMQLLATTFSERKQELEARWHRGEEVATEDLRLALRQYRSFFDRLLTT